MASQAAKMKALADMHRRRCNVLQSDSEDSDCENHPSNHPSNHSRPVIAVADSSEDDIEGALLVACCGLVQAYKHALTSMLS